MKVAFNWRGAVVLLNGHLSSSNDSNMATVMSELNSYLLKHGLTINVSFFGDFNARVNTLSSSNTVKTT